MSINNNTLINSQNIRFSNTKTCLEIGKNNELKENTYYFTQKLKSATNKLWQYFGYNSITENNLEVSLKHTLYHLEQILNNKDLSLTNEQLSKTILEVENILNNEHFKPFLNSNRGVNAKTYLENIQFKLEEISLKNIYKRIDITPADQKLLEIHLEIKDIKPKGEMAKLLLESIQFKLEKNPHNKAMHAFITKEPTKIGYELWENITKFKLNLDNYPTLKKNFTEIKQRVNKLNEENAEMLHKSTELMKDFKSNDDLVKENLKKQDDNIQSRVSKRIVDNFIKKHENFTRVVFNRTNSNSSILIEKQKSHDHSTEKTIKKELKKNSFKLNSNDNSFITELTEQKLDFSEY